VCHSLGYFSSPVVPFTVVTSLTCCTSLPVRNRLRERIRRRAPYVTFPSISRSLVSDQLGGHGCPRYKDCLKTSVALGIIKGQAAMCSQRSVGFRPYQKHLLLSTIYFENGEKAFGYKSELVCSGRVMLAVDRKGKGGGYNDSLGCSRLRAQIPTWRRLLPERALVRRSGGIDYLHS
jgi:hypothetical protein